MRNNIVTQFQKAAFSTGCGFFAMTLLTNTVTYIQKGLGSALPIVIKCEWIVVIIFFGLSGLFGLRLGTDIREVVKKRMEDDSEELDKSPVHNRKQVKARHSDDKIHIEDDDSSDDSRDDS